MSKKMKKLFIVFIVIVIMLSVQSTVFAADDPIAVVNNLSEFSAPVSDR